MGPSTRTSSPLLQALSLCATNATRSSEPLMPFRAAEHCCASHACVCARAVSEFDPRAYAERLGSGRHDEPVDPNAQRPRRASIKRVQLPALPVGQGSQPAAAQLSARATSAPLPKVSTSHTRWLQRAASKGDACSKRRPASAVEPLGSARGNAQEPISTRAATVPAGGLPRIL